MGTAPFFAQSKDAQRPSTISPGVAQLSLLAERRPCPAVDKSRLLALPNFRRALRYSVSLNDLEPKQVYEPLDMDKATWSRIENGTQSFPADDLIKLTEIVGNDGLLMWLVHQRGYELRPLKSELQERLDQREAELAEERRENALLRKLILERK
jgi:plasmid maintenance system antidote protein VapI